MSRPCLRFREFNEEWTYEQLKDISTQNVKSPYNVGDVKDMNKGYIPFFTSGDEIHYVSNYLVDGETIFINDGGTADIKYHNGKANYSNHVLSLSTNKLNTRFLYSYLTSKIDFINHNYFKGLGLKNLDKQEFLKFKVPFPSLPEQERLGKYFNNIDKIIENQTYKLTKLEMIKKSLLSNLFPKKDSTKPFLRFKGFDEEWKQAFFNDLCRLHRGLTYTPSDIKKDGILVLRSSNIFDGKLVFNDDDVYVRRLDGSNPIVDNGDILITSANGSKELVGKHAVVNSIKDNIYHGGFMLLAKPLTNTYFINGSMDTYWYKDFLNENVTGANCSIGNISANTLGVQKLLIPSLKEQQTIGKYLQTLDRIINLNKQKLTKLKNIKQSLLHKLLV